MTCKALKAADVLSSSVTNSRNSHILLPFLYQTSTIQRRKFSHRPQNQQQEAPVANSEEAETRSLIRKVDETPIQPLVRRRAASSKRDTSFRTERDLLQQRAKEKQELNLQKRQAREALPESEHDKYFRTNPQEAPKPRPKKTTTLTDIEKNAFDKLFRSLALQAQQQEEEDARRDTEGTDAVTLVDEVEDIGERNIGDLDVDRIINRELQLAAPNIEQFPADLRQMALETQTKLAQSRAARERRARLEQQDPVTAKAQTVMKVISSRLKGASTDVELWRILDTAVFAHVRAIDTEGKKVEAEQVVQLDEIGRVQEDRAMKVAQTRARAKRDSLRNKRFPGEEPTRIKHNEVADEEHVACSSTASSAVSTTPKEKQELMDLPILRRVYPAALLLAVRILSRSNHTPYIASLLPTIRSLHPYSLILGASTALYNELLRYTWRTSSSLASVLALLQDMSKLELTMDSRTWEILEQITLYRYRALRGDFGQGLRAMEGMKKRFDEGGEVWRIKGMIKVGLEQMELERSGRMEAEQVELDRSKKVEDEARAASFWVRYH